MEIGEGLDGIEKNDFYFCVHPDNASSFPRTTVSVKRGVGILITRVLND